MNHDDLKAALVEAISMHNELRLVPHPSLQVFPDYAMTQLLAAQRRSCVPIPVQPEGICELIKPIDAARRALEPAELEVLS